MNFHYAAQRLLGRPTCILERGATLHRFARIRNKSGDDLHIRIGAHSLIDGEVWTFAQGGNIEIGEWCYVGLGARIWSAASIVIGDRVFIAHNVNIFDNLTHPMHAGARHEQFRAIVTTNRHPKDIDLGGRAISIGCDAWIGANASILRGVKVGEGAIVGVGAVVTKNVPAYTVVAGNPARVIRELTPQERH
jgi:acetyltransferase-like isoleucine patch superfamily enzyme